MSGRPNRQYIADIDLFLNDEPDEKLLSKLEQKPVDPRSWEERWAEDPNVCKFYTNPNKGCRFGPECKYKHPSPPLHVCPYCGNGRHRKERCPYRYLYKYGNQLNKGADRSQCDEVEGSHQSIKERNNKHNAQRFTHKGEIFRGPNPRLRASDSSEVVQGATVESVEERGDMHPTLPSHLCPYCGSGQHAKEKCPHRQLYTSKK